MSRASTIHRLAVGASRHCRHALPAVALVCAAALALALLAPAPAHAADLFPVDDWIGEGLKKTGDVVLGPLKLGAEQIAKLLAAVVGALADLLIPKSLVRAGVDGIAWLVQLPPVGATLTPSDGGYALTVHMPHVAELRGTLTWIGITLLPLGLVLAGGRALLAPSLYGDSPTEILLRVVAAGIGLVVSGNGRVRRARELCDSLRAQISGTAEAVLLGWGEPSCSRSRQSQPGRPQ